MSRRRSLLASHPTALLLLWSAICGPFATRVLYADGGHIALHATAGPYSVTLFTAPDPLIAGPVDLSLLVQDARSEAVLGSATALGTLKNGRSALHFTLTHRQASNKILLAATPVVAAGGTYELRLEVACPGLPAQLFTTALPVAADHRRRTTLLFAVTLPLAVILVFLVNQKAKRSASIRRRLL